MDAALNGWVGKRGEKASGQCILVWKGWNQGRREMVYEDTVWK